MTDRVLKAWGMRLLLPLLLLNVTVANQQWSVGPVMISQVLFFWPAIMCAFVVVVFTWGAQRIWPLLLLGGVVAGRAAGVNNSEGWSYLAYAVPLHGLFLFAGSVVAMQARLRLLRQLRLYFLLTVPFMFLQVAGAGEWTLALNTETTAVGDSDISEARVVRRMLFVPPTEDPMLTIGQSRPAGFMHANNILSFVIMFALALQFGRIRSPRPTSTDILFCTAMVLAMAKIVMLSFLIMVGWVFLTGSRRARRRVRGVVIATAALYAIYAFLFPLLFFHHFNVYHVTYSVYIRVNDFLGTLDPDSPIAQYLAPKLEDTPQLTADEGAAPLSGYAIVSNMLPAVLIAAPIMFVVLRRSFVWMRRFSADGSRSALLVLMVALLFPAAVPYWRSPLYWFIFGAGLTPVVWHLLRPPMRPVRRVPLSQPGLQNQ
jgi:hypothetical protein